MKTLFKTLTEMNSHDLIFNTGCIFAVILFTYEFGKYLFSLN